MPERQAHAGGEGLSLQTLVVAAAASAAAAVIVSHIWKDGTVIAAAMTPVIVAIVKELLQRPMESEIVRKPVQKVSGIASSRLPVPSRTPTRGTGDPVLPPTERYDDPSGDGAPPTEGELTPMRTYGRTSRRPLHLKVAIVTGLIAFLIAAAALTLPELLFGGAISSRHDTTLFGGGGASKSDKKKNQDQGTSTQPDKSQSNQQKTTPATPPATSGSKPPPSTTPSQTSPQQPPQQTTPQQTTPVPTTPTPPTP